MPDEPADAPPRSKSGPKALPITDEQVLAWVVANPRAGFADLQREFGISRSAAHRKWTNAHKAILAQKAGEHRARTPANRMPEQDRETVLGTVRDAESALRTLARQAKEQIETAAAAGQIAMLDRDTAQAALSWQRTVAGLIEMHPGLLELAREAEDQKATDDDLDGILTALGVTDDDPQPPPRGAAD